MGDGRFSPLNPFFAGSSAFASSTGSLSLLDVDGPFSETDEREGASALVTFASGLLPFADIGVGIPVFGPGEEGDTTVTVSGFVVMDVFFLRCDRVLGDEASEGDTGEAMDDAADSLERRSLAFTGDMGDTAGLGSSRERREGLGFSSAGDATGDERSDIPLMEDARPLPRPREPRKDPPLAPLELPDPLEDAAAFASVDACPDSLGLDIKCSGHRDVLPRLQSIAKYVRTSSESQHSLHTDLKIENGRGFQDSVVRDLSWVVSSDRESVWDGMRAILGSVSRLGCSEVCKLPAHRLLRNYCLGRYTWALSVSQVFVRRIALGQRRSRTSQFESQLTSCSSLALSPTY